jgi:hypothetical protein
MPFTRRPALAACAIVLIACALPVHAHAQAANRLEALTARTLQVAGKKIQAMALIPVMTEDSLPESPRDSALTALVRTAVFAVTSSDPALKVTLIERENLDMVIREVGLPVDQATAAFFNNDRLTARAMELLAADSLLIPQFSPLAGNSYYVSLTVLDQHAAIIAAFSEKISEADLFNVRPPRPPTPSKPGLLNKWFVAGAAASSLSAFLAVHEDQHLQQLRDQLVSLLPNTSATATYTITLDEAKQVQTRRDAWKWTAMGAGAFAVFWELKTVVQRSRWTNQQSPYVRWQLSVAPGMARVSVAW